jgi:thiol peroxidase
MTAKAHGIALFLFTFGPPLRQPARSLPAHQAKFWINLPNSFVPLRKGPPPGPKRGATHFFHYTILFVHDFRFKEAAKRSFSTRQFWLIIKEGRPQLRFGLHPLKGRRGIPMERILKFVTLVLGISFFVMGCAAMRPQIPMEQGSSQPGGTVTRGGAAIKLLGTAVSVGQPLPSVKLVDAMTMKEVDLSQEKGAVLFLSIVPSIDTKVCEEQTHYLGEEGEKLSKEIRRITISRDTPFAQKRFAQEAKLANLQYLSDYKEGGFGKASGLLMEGSLLLTRAVVLADKKGTIRYIQVVPEITRLPDMERAFQKAGELARE